MYEMKIVTRILERLAEIGENQSWLSKKTGISQASLCRIVAGKGVHLETAMLISTILRVPIETLWKFQEVDTDEKEK